MASITFKGSPASTCGDLPSVGSTAPEFKLVKTDLSEISLADFAGKKKILNIFPSLDTPVCANSVRKFNEEAGKVEGGVIINISADLPFAQKRFCGAEGIETAITSSTFRSSFAKDYGVELNDSPLAGLCHRAVVVLDADNKVVYTQLVGEVTEEPDYDKALAAIR
ncbi:MAG: thiol peroxidase [Nitrospinota bacterium]